ncbi:MAG: hypothetical protein C4521_06565 [Actinobacteria bacterium]|nr:MAG: hypothetical protein C4521_06565 [Actinomycetota bacterium]
MTLKATLVAVASALLLLLVFLYRAQGQARPINLRGSVDSLQCSPCHASIGDESSKKLIFNHGWHLLVSCQNCHFQFAHVPGRTITPPMMACINCHRLTHSSQGQIARGGCRDCHPRSMNLRPRDHKAGFAGRRHVAAAKRDLNNCMMCHEERFCKDCHARKRVKERYPRLYVFQAIVPLETTRQPVFMVNQDQPVNMGQCVGCHLDLDAFPVIKVIFPHDVHLKRGFQCGFCHLEFPHSQQGTKTPPMETCYACHNSKHGRRGVIATGECYACHPKSFDLVPTWHRVPQFNRRHAKRAKAGVASCLMCHKEKFCSDCHMSEKAVPKDHKQEQEWRATHGQQYTQMKQNCRICHTAQNCKDCHRVDMPHPIDFIKTHRELGRNARANNCMMCHSSQFCGKCHHSGIANALLVEKTCIGCHPNAGLPWQDLMPLGDKGMVVHSVHFKKRFRCEECHPTVETKRNQAHNFELCYECHGALDINKTLIAPYPGQDLCLRCHNKAI